MRKTGIPFDPQGLQSKFAVDLGGRFVNILNQTTPRLQFKNAMIRREAFSGKAVGPHALDVAIC